MLKVIFVVKLFLLLGLFVNAENGIVHYGLMENKVLKLFKEFQSRMCHDLDRFGIPALDPFKYKHLDFSFDSPLAQLSGSVSDVRSTGLSNIKIENLKVSALLVMKLKVIFPAVHLKGKFKAEGMLGELFPINGNGDFEFTIEDLTIEAKLKLHSADEVYIKDIEAKPKVGKVSGNIKNLVPDEEVNDFINDVLNNRSPEILDAFWEESEKEILAEIEKISKYLLRNVTSKDISKIIFGNEPVFNENDPKDDC